MPALPLSLQGSSVPPSLLLKAPPSLPPAPGTQAALVPGLPAWSRALPQSFLLSHRGTICNHAWSFLGPAPVPGKPPRGEAAVWDLSLGQWTARLIPRPAGLESHLPPHPTSPCPSGSVSDSSYGLVLGGTEDVNRYFKMPCTARMVRRSQHRAVDARWAFRWRRLAQPAGLGRSSTPAWLCLVRDTIARIPP